MQFEGIAKTNTTHTGIVYFGFRLMFEGIAKTNTTHTNRIAKMMKICLRVLLKQIQHIPR